MGGSIHRRGKHSATGGETWIAALVHITASRRGTVDVVPGGRTFIGTALDATVHFDDETEPAVAGHHAELTAGENEFAVAAVDDHTLFVNGARVDRAVLAQGDVIQVGEDGPVLRYRIYAGEVSPYKTPIEALRDCLTNARYCSSRAGGRPRAFADAVPGEMLQLSPAMRWSMVAAMMLFVASIAGLGYHVYTLEQRLERRAEQIDSVSAELFETRQESIDFSALAEMEERITGTRQEIDDLESRMNAPREIIAGASDAVGFVQGAFGFVEPDSGKRLRMALGDDGQPIRVSADQVRVRLGGEGPPIERSYTGTAFVVDAEGLLVTNRHVAEPWAFDERAQDLIERGLEVKHVRMIAYLPGRQDPFEVDLVAASHEADLAVLQGQGIAGEIEPLPLAERSPEAGEPIILLGYPTGIQALIARAAPSLLDGIEDARQADFWQVASRLSEAGAIEPLATSGIVGQVTTGRIVYDAGTQAGGSGGPLLDHAGHVVAVNQAIMRDFQGSNLGVPVEYVHKLIERAHGGS